MKSCGFLLMLIGLSTFGFAQDAGTSVLTVMEHNWKVSHQTPANSVLNEDPFEAINETNRVLIARRDTARANEMRKKDGLPPLLPPTARAINPASGVPSYSPDALYTYRLRVRNETDKAITNVTWDYIFLDPVTKAEVGRHSFESSTDLKPRKTGRLDVKIVSPPTGTVDARHIDKKTSDLYLEEIRIRKIVYADGTVWQLGPPR